MFRPFKLLKKVMPKTLFARSVLIILLPLIFVQIISTYVFIDRHWDWVTRLLANDMATYIQIVAEQIEKDKKINDTYAGRFSLDVKKDSEHTHFFKTKKNYSWDEAYFDQYLKDNFSYPYRLAMDKDEIHVDALINDSVYHFSISKKRLFSKTTPIFLMWSLGTPILFFMIAVLFMRNQIRPIRRLTQAVSRFGRGDILTPHKLEGAEEIRLAGAAFNRMRERILRHMAVRTEMLAGVSHDLRTPLTRMELQLAIMEKSEATDYLKNDLRQLREIVTEYLTFARGDDQEKSQDFSLSALLRSITADFQKQYPKSTIEFKSKRGIRFYGRKVAVGRCLDNLLSNATSFADTVKVSLIREEKSISVIIEDDGPGIPVDKREDVLKPFYRLEGSRNRKTGGTGLGLAIAHDVVSMHGGEIFLKDSALGGLKLVITLPI